MAKPKLTPVDQLNRLQCEAELTLLRTQEEAEGRSVAITSRKFALHNRLKQLPKAPPPEERDPDVAYPL